MPSLESNAEELSERKSMEGEEPAMELDIEELEYSELSGRYSTGEENNGSDTTSDSEVDEEIPALSTLQPYEFEPTCEPRSSEDLIEKVSSRVGNTGWCLCGECRPMETEEESYCCMDTNEVPEKYFEGLL